VNRVARLADGAGVFGAAFAALCCAGTSFIVSALAAVGLSFLRNDAILWPLMFASLAVALWGFWHGRAVHGSAGPLGLAAAGAAALVAGVVVIHGFPAKQVIWAGAGALVAATLWNVSLRRRCTTMAGRSRRDVGAPMTHG
jgi:mercuric ion transport protein